MPKKVCDINNMNVCNCPLATGGFRGRGQGGPAQNARDDEVTLSTKDFSVQFYTKCAVFKCLVLSLCVSPEHI